MCPLRKTNWKVVNRKGGLGRMRRTCLLICTHIVGALSLDQKPVLKTFYVGPNSLFTLPKQRVSCDLKRFKNRLQECASMFAPRKPRELDMTRSRLSVTAAASAEPCQGWLFLKRCIGEETHPRPRTLSPCPLSLSLPRRARPPLASFLVNLPFTNSLKLWEFKVAHSSETVQYFCMYTCVPSREKEVANAECKLLKRLLTLFIIFAIMLSRFSIY